MLNALPSCEVGDASAIAVNLADQPLRITGMTLAMTAGGSGRASYQVAAVRPGFIGEIATNFDMAVLAPYRPEPALGTLLAPQAAKDNGYVFIALLRVTGMHARSWAITGLTVHYQLGRHAYTAFFPQAIKLPPVNCSQ